MTEIQSNTLRDCVRDARLLVPALAQASNDPRADENGVPDRRAALLESALRLLSRAGERSQAVVAADNGTESVDLTGAMSDDRLWTLTCTVTTLCMENGT